MIQGENDCLILRTVGNTVYAIDISDGADSENRVLWDNENIRE